MYYIRVVCKNNKPIIDFNIKYINSNNWIYKKTITQSYYNKKTNLYAIKFYLKFTQCSEAKLSMNYIINNELYHKQ